MAPDGKTNSAPRSSSMSGRLECPRPNSEDQRLGFTRSAGGLAAAELLQETGFRRCVPEAGTAGTQQGRLPAAKPVDVRALMSRVVECHTRCLGENRLSRVRARRWLRWDAVRETNNPSLTDHSVPGGLPAQNQPCSACISSTTRRAGPLTPRRALRGLGRGVCLRHRVCRRSP